jgi:flagellar assembly protein FliH
MAVMDTTSHVQRFKFASFDGKDEAPVAVKQEAPPKAQPVVAAPADGPMHLPLQLPAITEKDLAAARSEAQAAGYREGYAAAQGKFNKEAAAREDAIKSLLEIIANRITIAAETHATSMKEREDLMARLTLAAARKVAGEAIKREPFAAVQSLLHETLNLVADESQVTVVVSSALAAGLKQRIDMLKPMLGGFSGELKVEEDPHLLDQDCRVEWGNGFAERNTDALWKEIEGIIMKTNVT